MTEGLSRRRIAWLVGAIIIISLVLWVVLRPPGGEPTVDEGERPDLPTPFSEDPVERLRMIWDSESHTASWPVAETLASISDIAYLDRVEADDSYRKLGFTDVESVEKGSMVGYVVSAGDVTVVVFRGTDDLVDWLVNLDIRSSNTPHGLIHTGFYNAYWSLKPKTATILEEKRPKHLWITGHSLGGAIALVCAYDLVENRKMKLSGIMTFGQPMIASRKLADYLGTLLLGHYAHVVNEEDIVAKVPPTYFHSRSLVWFTKDGIERSKPRHRVVGAAGDEKAMADDDSELIPLTQQEFEDLKAKLREEKAGKGLPSDSPPLVQGNLPLFRDHAMWRYLEKIRSLLGGTGSDLTQ